MKKLIDDALFDQLGEYYVQCHHRRVPDEEFGHFVDRMMLGRNSYGFLNPLLVDLGRALPVLMTLAQKESTND